MSDELMHYGIKKKSGRYPWGSGKDEYQRSADFNAYVASMKARGVPEKEIAKAIGLHAQEATNDPRAKFSVADLRATKTIAREEVVREQTNRAVTLRNKGVSIKEISADLGIPPPTVRLRLKNSENIKKSSIRSTADMLKANVDKHEIVDIGKGTELNIDQGIKMGISPERLKAAVAALRDEGYETYNLPVKNVGTKNFTQTRVLVPPGTGFGNARRMTDKIHTMGDFTQDDGLTWFGLHPPISVSSRRLKVNFKEDGGDKQDGLILVRPDVKDLDMGKNTYAQVRIMVDGTHYIKGMAIHSRDLPPGVDLVFNTNKSRTVGKMGALKEKESDSDNPFGSIIKRQIIERSKDGVEKVKSALNIVNEEGDWDDWRKSMPSQMLAKQPHSFIKSRLSTTREQLRSRLAEIDRITNPVVKQKALADFADKVDSDAVDLRAASMPRQRSQVIIPLPKINKSEIYAPNFETGERVVLIRFPHGGRFEIPEVTVNNNNRTAKALLGNAKDAIGIHPKVAERLSGADFDGDAVLVIPNRSGLIKGSKTMGHQTKVFDDGLRDFEPKKTYGSYEEKDGKGNFPLMKNTGLEMGKITNLITDMSVQGAKPEHILRAVRHSMVVIDAEKHKLDYKQSEQNENIKQLVQLYQSHPGTTRKPGGSSTLLSQATAKDRVPDFKSRSAKKGGPIDLDTGARRYEPTGKLRSVYDPKTKTYTKEKVPVTKEVSRLALTDDAYTLVRDKADPIERLYADHVNEMKTLANTARLRAYRTPSPKINSKARVIYKDEVAKLDADLKAALKQSPLNRRADVIAGQMVKAKRMEDPLLRTDKDRNAKVERQAKMTARARLGLSEPVIDVSDRQWDAIQSGAVSASKLREILRFTDDARINELALPHTNPVMSSAITARAKAMLAANNTNAEVAAALGIPLSTLRSAALRGDL